MSSATNNARHPAVAELALDPVCIPECLLKLFPRSIKAADRKSSVKRRRSYNDASLLKRLLNERLKSRVATDWIENGIRKKNGSLTGPVRNTRAQRLRNPSP